MNTKSIAIPYEHMSPAGAEVRSEMSNALASVAHCTLTAGKVSKAVAHKTVSEFWYILSGNGEIWCRQGSSEKVISLVPGLTLEIPLGTDFQYRCIGEKDLVFICFTTPPWPGSDEVRYLEKGIWT
jgi:mannose-6-phosphate isomerase-like protein (cupin superfamily)